MNSAYLLHGPFQCYTGYSVVIAYPLRQHCLPAAVHCPRPRTGSTPPKATPKCLIPQRPPWLKSSPPVLIAPIAFGSMAIGCFEVKSMPGSVGAGSRRRPTFATRTRASFTNLVVEFYLHPAVGTIVEAKHSRDPRRFDLPRRRPTTSLRSFRQVARASPARTIYLRPIPTDRKSVRSGQGPEQLLRSSDEQGHQTTVADLLTVTKCHALLLSLRAASCAGFQVASRSHVMTIRF
jgi:hypothetical protein